MKEWFRVLFIGVFFGIFFIALLQASRKKWIGEASEEAGKVKVRVGGIDKALDPIRTAAELKGVP